LCGLSPSSLIYNVRVFLTYLLLIVPPAILLIILVFINPFYACAGVLLLIPTWYLLQSGFQKWDATDVAGF